MSNLWWWVSTHPPTFLDDWFDNIRHLIWIYERIGDLLNSKIDTSIALIQVEAEYRAGVSRIVRKDARILQ